MADPNLTRQWRFIAQVQTALVIEAMGVSVMLKDGFDVLPSLEVLDRAFEIPTAGLPTEPLAQSVLDFVHWHLGKAERPSWILDGDPVLASPK